jgi:ribose-phosphate pyrophosphokinase
VIEDDIRKAYETKDLMIVSPDVGGVVRARALASRIGADIAIVDKRRPQPGQAEVMNIIGEVDGRRCIIFDDIIDSGGTLCNAAAALKERGATEVSAYITHGVLSGKAVERIGASELTELVVTDSIDSTHKLDGGSTNIRALSVAPLLAEAIRRIANDESVSKLFD